MNGEYLNITNDAMVRGVAMENHENLPVILTEESVETIAKAFCVWLISHTGKVKVSVAVGFDCRLSSPALCEAAVKGITSTGHDAVVTDLSSTPSMLALLQDDTWKETYPCEGALMIGIDAASATYYNGLQFFYIGGKLSTEQVASILQIANTYRYAEPNEPGKRIEVSYMDRYAETLVSLIRSGTGEDTPLQNKKIVVNAGNGVGGFFVNKVLIPLGANTNGSQFLEPDGNFPNHLPCLKNATALTAISDAVKSVNADMGILFNGCASRACAIDQDGNPIKDNRLIALLSVIYLSDKASTFVTDSITSNGLTKFIKVRGGIHHRYMCGSKNITEEAIRLNRLGEYVPLAIETNGYVGLLENDFREDGAYLMARILIALVNASKADITLTDLIADLEIPKEELSVELPFVDSDGLSMVSGKVLHDFYNYATRTPYITLEEENYEGYRVNYDEGHGNGWALLRTSQDGTMLSINVESDSEHGAIKIAKDLYYFLRKCPFVDTSLLKKSIDEERARLVANIRKDFYRDASYLTFLFGEKVIVQGDECPQAEETEQSVTAPSPATSEEMNSTAVAEDNV